MSTHSLKRTCGRAPLSSNCIAPMAMAAQRAATFKAIESETRFGTRARLSVARCWCVVDADGGG
eukprot:4349606-Pleurochrysis_carterae.AAC.1